MNNLDGTVTDKKTGLMWQKGDSGDTPLTCDQANAYCPGLDLDGYTDWRLPEIEALLTVVDYTRFNPALSMIFDPYRSNFYWSSSTYAPDPTGAWNVYFGNGEVHSSIKTNGGYVRCVRGGP